MNFDLESIRAEAASSAYVPARAVIERVLSRPRALDSEPAVTRETKEQLRRAGALGGGPRKFTRPLGRVSLRLLRLYSGKGDVSYEVAREALHTNAVSFSSLLHKLVAGGYLKRTGKTGAPTFAVTERGELCAYRAPTDIAVIRTVARQPMLGIERLLEVLNDDEPIKREALERSLDRLRARGLLRSERDEENSYGALLWSATTAGIAHVNDWEGIS